MAIKNAGNIAKGDYLLFRGSPCQVTKTEFMNPGKGSAINRIRMKNVTTGAVNDFTYKTSETVETLNVDKKQMTFLYHDSNEVIFMDPATYEQASVPLSLLEDQIGFLIPNLLCWVLWYQDKAIGVMLPPHVNLKVIESPDATAGNRVNSPKKEVTTETGLKVQAPIFIKEGEIITVDTTSGEYISRAN
jgi:elongation factor P